VKYGKERNYSGVPAGTCLEDVRVVTRVSVALNGILTIAVGCGMD
jgi:hypothetical protein